MDGFPIGEYVSAFQQKKRNEEQAEVNYGQLLGEAVSTVARPFIQEREREKEMVFNSTQQYLKDYKLVNAQTGDIAGPDIASQFWVDLYKGKAAVKADKDGVVWGTPKGNSTPYKWVPKTESEQFVELNIRPDQATEMQGNFPGIPIINNKMIVPKDSYRTYIGNITKPKEEKEPKSATEAEMNMKKLTNQLIGELKQGYFTDKKGGKHTILDSESAEARAYEIGVGTEDPKIAELIKVAPDKEALNTKIAEYEKSLPIYRKLPLIGTGVTPKEKLDISKGMRGGTTQDSTQEGRIAVISPSGEEGTIPASQLQKALKKGYKQK